MAKRIPKRKHRKRGGIGISRDERNILRTKLAKYCSSENIVKMLERINPNVVTSRGNKLTAQYINHLLSHGSDRAISNSVACAIYELCGSDSALSFLIDRIPYKPEVRTTEIKDIATAREYTSSVLYNIAIKVIREVFVQLDERKKSGMIDDLESLSTKYKTNSD